MTTSLDALHEQGRAALLAGTPRLDVPPGDGDRRWGLSVLLIPQGELAQRFATETQQLAALAGPGQWATGGAGSAHLTLYSLEPHRDGLTTADSEVRRYADVMTRAAAASPAATFDVTGLALTPGGVVVACDPADDPARQLRRRFNEALGVEAFEASYRGDQWWSSLLHFAAPVADPAGLVAHVEARRHQALGRFTATALDLVRYEYRQAADGPRMVPVTLVRAGLAA